MQTIKIKMKQGKNIAYLYLLLDYDSSITDQKRFVSVLCQNINNSKFGYAGFKSKKHLQRYLLSSIFASQNGGKIPQYRYHKGEIIKLVEQSIKSCHKIISTEPSRIFVFPTFHSFIKKKMTGVSGYTPGRNVIHIYLNPTKGWQAALKGTIAHEFNHLVFFKYHRCQTLLDSIIFEGLAENFKNYAVGGRLSPWSRALTFRGSKKLFLKLKGPLKSKSAKLYQSVFFGSGNYPLWAGYSVGYYLVKSFLGNNQKTFGWTQIMRLKTKEILKKSIFAEIN